MLHGVLFRIEKMIWISCWLVDLISWFPTFQTDEVFLEAQIQNITTSPMFMEKVSLEPSLMYNVIELNTVAAEELRYCMHFLFILCMLL